MIHSEDLLDELQGYVNSDSGDIVASKILDLSSGARERHGDRVIAVGLCVLTTRDQAKALFEKPRNPPPGSFIARFYKWKEKEREREEKYRRFRF